MARTVSSSKELHALPAYRLEYEEYLKDCSGQGMVFTHIKSGARVMVISNADENKVFGIAFRTPPTDDTGVAHILEHSVLCGSRKFPVKDPFMELCKGSLNTFLNAFTYPDKTCYPVASCNDKDFANLMDVYMDAVLYPDVYKHPEIFKQEGWHYEINSPEEPVTVNGIVYSEMKGAFSNPEDRMSRETFSALFPDTAYGVESGGDPKAIPNLTYEQFLDFHSRYYHPTNSYIFLYGDVDVEERLEWLDEAYLREFDVQPVDSEVRIQEPIGTIEKHAFYPLGEEDSDENAAYLSWACVVGTIDNPVELEAFNTIAEVLFNAPGAPVREALVKAGIGQDMSCFISDDVKQPFLTLSVRNTEASKLEDLKRILKSELEKVVKEGFNANSLLASINSNEFNYCEEDTGYMPKGLFYAVNALSTWLHDDRAAFTMLHRRNIFPEIREKIGTGFFENLVQKYLLNSESQVFSCLEPKRGLASEDEAKLEAKMAEFKASLSDREIEKLIEDNKALKAYQAEASTPEQLATIPMLKREDIGKKAQKINTVEEEYEGIRVIRHDIETNGIAYVKLLFDLDGIEPELVPYLTLAAKLIGAMDTKNRSYLEYSNDVNIHTGGIFEDVATYGKRDNSDYYRPVFTIGARAMEHEIANMFKLMEEGIYLTDFTSVSRIRELLGETKARRQYGLMNAGHNVAIGRASSYISSAGRFKDMVSGYGYYEFVLKLLEASDEELAGIADIIKGLFARILGRDNMIIDITGRKDVADKIKAELHIMLDRMGNVRNKAEGDRCGRLFAAEAKNEAFKSSGEVTFLAMSGRFGEIDEALGGALPVAQTILSNEYLWNNIRVLSGAYGCGFSYSMYGHTAFFYSYRDPKLAETYATYKKAVEYLESFDCDERQMTKFIIGTIGGLDTPLSPEAKGNRELTYALGGVTEEILQSIRDNVLAATPAEIRRVAEVVRQLVSTDNYCAVGCEGIINKNAGMFKEIKNLI